MPERTEAQKRADAKYEGTRKNPLIQARVPPEYWEKFNRLADRYGGKQQAMMALIDADETAGTLIAASWVGEVGTALIIYNQVTAK